jgi:hypothetical protein
MNKLGDDFEVHAVDIRPDRNQVDMGLGISLEGTVDIVEGTGSMLFSHHFIESYVVYSFILTFTIQIYHIFKG